jgi:1-acyl-sn-glycerol-3-phosphate acyltransferase
MTDERRSSPKRRLDHLFLHHVIAFVLRLWFRLYGRWRVVGLENVPRTGALLFAANHASYLDPLLGWAAIYGHRRMWGIAKNELWHNRLLAYFMDCIGSIPVKRNAADRAMLRRVFDLLAQGEAVGLFPEGTRTQDGLLNPAQPGIAMMVQKSGVPVVPVALLGTYEMLPRGRKRLKRVPLTVAFGAPMTFAPDAARETITTAIMEAIAALMTANGRPTVPPAPDRVAPIEAE